jgi:O-antigen/teichoic acid export membrane protein
MLSFSILITLSVIASVSCSFYAKEIMELLYRDNGHLQEAIQVFQIIIWGFILISTSYVFGTLLTANGNLKQLNIIALVGIGVNLTVNFLLIPRLMATGSAIASLSTQLATVVLQLFIVKKVFKMVANKKKIFQIGLFIAGTIFICFISKFIPLFPFINFGLAVIFSLLLAVLLKIITPRFILKMWREEIR